MFNSIDNTEELPAKFYDTIDKFYPEYYETTFWESIINRILSNKNTDCRCSEIYLPYIPSEQLKNKEKFPFGLRLSYTSHVALELENKYNQRKCYSYYLSHASFSHGIEGVKSAAEKFYNKNLNELSEREILELNLITKANYAYSPTVNRERLDNAINMILKKK